MLKFKTPEYHARNPSQLHSHNHNCWLPQYALLSLRLRLVRVKAFSENISFSGNAIFWKGKCIQVFGCVGIHFTENQFWCLVRTNILRKMTSVLRKINSHVCFSQTFYGKWNSFFYRKSFLMFGLWIILQKITISSTCIT